MNPTLALFLWGILLVTLLWLDPAKVSKTSPALWIPVVWMFILGSRLPSQWLGGQVGMAVEALEEGNPLDRTVSLMLILLAIGVLVSRSFNSISFASRNLALIAFLSFALVSVVWSDFPFVAFKRWIRDLGNYIVILVVLSDPNEVEAIRTVLRRLSYLLIPLSVVLVKYFPDIGRGYDAWTGIAMYTGATTSKNMLGLACLISAMFFFWETLTRWPERKKRRNRLILTMNAAFLGMTLWLMNLANSTTSRVCLVLGCLVMLLCHTSWIKRHPAFLKVTIPACFCLYLVLAYGFDMNGNFAGAVGKDPTLTDRTKIWSIVLSMHTNPIIGTGYESFWLGPRLEWFWQRGLGHINEAHNGFLEVYLNLGIIGLFLLVLFLIASFKTICRRLEPFSSLASLTLAIWITTLFYSATEAGFRSGLMWLTFLIGGISTARRSDFRVRNVVPSNTLRGTGRFDGVPSSLGKW